MLPAASMSSGAAVAVGFAPEENCIAFAVDVIDRAEREILVNAYALTTSSGIVEALVRAKHRGVDVKLIADRMTPCERGSGIEPLTRSGIPVWIDHDVRIARVKGITIDRKVVLTGSMNWSGGAAWNSEDLNLIKSEAVAAAYATHWQSRLVVSVPYFRREGWCRSPDVTGLKSEAPLR
jgi:phosphatidylserine/phosphatidylglycerophosphate/cardiolipin synthase-like enzyme